MAGAKARTRDVVELWLMNPIGTKRGALTYVGPENSKDVKYRVTADLDAQTLGVYVPGEGTTHIHFSQAKCWKYGMATPKL